MYLSKEFETGSYWGSRFEQECLIMKVVLDEMLDLAKALASKEKAKMAYMS